MIATRVRHGSIGFGDSGTLDDLSHMATLVEGSLASPAVVMTARHLAKRNPRAPIAHALAIRDFLRMAWRYVDDPAGRELLRDPDHMLAEYHATGHITGDCDEAAILGAALGKAIGLDAEFVVLGFASADGGDNGAFSHVYTDLLTPDGGRVSLDVTRPPGQTARPVRALAVGW